MKFYFSAINLGCNKNFVDLEFIIWKILDISGKFDIRFFSDAEDREVEFVLINTCGFLSTSRQEAEETIKYYDKLGKKIILLGCYVPVKNDKFLSGLKNLYAIISANDYDKVEKILFKKSLWFSNFKASNLNSKAFIWKWNEPRIYLNQIYKYEYLKIAEWCDNKCSFCIIPKLRWTQCSRKMEDILDEVKVMVKSWIKEIIIIAQDTTRYWSDLYSKPKLLELLEKLEKIPWNFKYRLLYMYPDNLTLDLLKKLKTFKKFIPYFDIPFQHVSENVLKKMWRYYNEKWIFSLLDFIKNNFKIYYLRTAFIIGFPWENEEDFCKLKDFIKNYKFDSVALFEYHDEPLAASNKLKNKVSSKIALSRIKELDKIIKKIYKEKKLADIWKKQTWYIMDYNKKSVIIRRELRAPEIDEYDEIKINDLWKVKIGSKINYFLG